MLEPKSQLGAVARWLTDWRFVVGVSVGAVTATLGAQLLRVDPPPAPEVEAFSASVNLPVSPIRWPAVRSEMARSRIIIEPYPSHLAKLRPGQRRVWRSRPFEPPFLLQRLTPQEEVRSALLRRTYTGRE